jgi:hypothetical protein
MPDCQDTTMGTGNPASDTLEVVAAPSLSKQFTDDPVAPGGTVTLEFTLDNSGENVVADANGVTFTDDLAATITGLAATGLPLNDVCGTGNGTLTGSVGDTMLMFSGGTVAAGETCTFSVNLQVPAGALNIVTGLRPDLVSPLAAHDDVDGLWYFPDDDGGADVERLSAANMKRTWIGGGRDWTDAEQGVADTRPSSAVRTSSIVEKRPSFDLHNVRMIVAATYGGTSGLAVSSGAGSCTRSRETSASASPSSPHGSDPESSS